MIFGSSVNVHVWKPDWWHFTPKVPVWVTSKKQLLRECENRGYYSVGYG